MVLFSTAATVLTLVGVSFAASPARAHAHRFADPRVECGTGSDAGHRPGGAVD
jgi:hypothetical protein